VNCRWAGHVACVGRMQNAYKLLFGNPRPRDQLQDLDVEDNLFKIDLKNIEFEDVEWILLAQDTFLWPSLVNMIGIFKSHKWQGIFPLAT
jgi:hypothetical protein